jgi:site-specific DNA-methyltransferase (adenine-specific)
MSLNRALFMSETVEWPTPKGVYDKLDKEFHFDFDPCPYGGTQDGLSTLFTPWRGKRVFCNPPYGPEIRKWLERAAEADLAVYLIPARTDTRWFHEEVLPNASEIRFVRGRLKFGDAQNSAPFPSMIVVYRSGGDK